MSTPFPVDPVLTAITIAYRNERLIADDVLPRTPVARQEFKWRKYRLADGLTLPDTKVGRLSAPNRVTFGFDEKTASTKAQALDMPVPNEDIANAGGTTIDPLGFATELGSELIALDREVRASKLVFNSGSYVSENVKATAPGAKWSKPDSKPMFAIMDALDGVMRRPTIGILGRAASTALRRNHQIVKAYHGNAGEDGLVPLGFLADLLELEALYVGEARLNIARPGQDVELHRVWGPHAAFIYRDRLAGPQGGTTFGFTAQWGNRTAKRIANENIGMNGGIISRVGEHVKEIVAAPELGCYFPDVVA